MLLRLQLPVLSAPSPGIKPRPTIAGAPDFPLARSRGLVYARIRLQNMPRLSRLQTVFKEQQPDTDKCIFLAKKRLKYSVRISPVWAYMALLVSEMASIIYWAQRLRVSFDFAFIQIS